VACSNTVSTAFLEPGDLAHGDMRLVVKELYPGNPAAGWVPAYRFAITVSGQEAGAIELRLGTSDFIQQFAGHVAYGVEPSYRGNRLAARALRLVLPLAGRHGFTSIWATVDPDNWASRRSCELAGATMVEIVDLPKDCDMYREGDRQRCRYRLEC
jgi:predicted acetyltransferase